MLNERRKKERKERMQCFFFRWDMLRESIFRWALQDMFGLTENDRGLFRGLDTEHISPGVLYTPQRASRGVRHIRRGQVREALLPVLFARHLRGPQGNVALVRSVSCLPFHAEADPVLEPRQKLLRAGRQTASLCPRFPQTPA